MTDKKTFNILIVDDEKDYRDVLEMMLGDEGYTTSTAINAEDALIKLEAESFDIVLTDLTMGKMDGIDLLKEIKKSHRDTEVILITGNGTIENAVEAMKIGANNYFIKGSKSKELLNEIEKVKNKIIEKNKSGAINLANKFMLESKSEKYKKMLEIARKAAKSDVNILILGESGVGKEIVANYIHANSSRANKQFIPINCSSFSSTMLEAELFGHEKGAFTGASSSREGLFESSNGGSLFLDEIGDIDLNTQVKLLRVIESKMVSRIGSNELKNIDFRLISATNKILHKETESGSFREDFFYRINTITIEVPPLRERREDLDLLINFFLNKSKADMNKVINEIEEEVLYFLHNHSYTGNIRELKNIIDRLVALSDNGIIKACDLPDFDPVRIDKDKSNSLQNKMEEELNNPINLLDIKPLKDIRKDFESEYIEKVLVLCEGNISKAARILNISRRQLYNKICEYDINQSDMT